MTVSGAFCTAALLAALAAPAAAADPETLWRIVHGECVPHEEANRDPAPCAFVDLSAGYVVLKDLVGATQFLVLPTARIEGIESPEIRLPGAPNYMADAWASRRFVEARAARLLARDEIALAINSVTGRTQTQLHIHVDCVRPDVRAALAAHRDAIGARWSPFPALLAGRSYLARQLVSTDLAGVNPFVLLAGSSPEALTHMGEYTLVAVGETVAGKQGFVLLADRADLVRGDRGSGEALEDHACAVAHL